MPAVITEPRDPEILATDEIPTTTWVTVTAVPSMPSHTHPLALLPRCRARPDLVNDAGHFVACDTRVLQPWPMSLLHKHVTMTDPACLHSDAHLVLPRPQHLSLDHFEWADRTTNLHRSHLCHRQASFLVEPISWQHHFS